MAYRRSNGKGRARKIEPAVKTMLFNLTVPASTQSEFTIDISQCASLVNRRFYRQGLNWAVASIKMITLTANPNTNIGVLKLPETWIMSNSWMKGFKVWQRMNEAAMTESESIRPRFLDFKIYADTVHHTAGFAGNLLPLAADSTTLATAGEWESSKYVVPKTDGTDDINSREVLAVGPSYPGASAVTTLNAVSLIEGYASSRGLPNVLDPNTPDDAKDAAGTAPENWMVALFNEGTEQDDQVIDDLITENNQAPYPFENAQIPGAAPGTTFTDTQYPGGANQLSGLQFHDVNTDSSTTIGGITRFAGGLFPCGLVRVVVNNVPNGAPVSYALQLDLVPGSHRGYLCEPMTEM